MRWISERHVTGAIFTGFLASGAAAMTLGYVILGRMIVDASAGEAGPLIVIASGAMVGTLTAFVIHEIGGVLPDVMARLHRG